MTRIRTVLAAAALGVSGLTGAALPTAASAAVDQSDPSRFIATLSQEAFGAIRNSAGNKAAARTKFRTLLSQYFAIDQIGDRLIAPSRGKMTPAQYQAYREVLPNFLIGAYSDRLFQYGNADVQVVRAVAAANGTAVLTRVIQPGQQPINGIWAVEKVGGGYKVTNLTVAGINLTLTQQADFNSFVQRRGVDALIAFMKSKA